MALVSPTYQLWPWTKCLSHLSLRFCRCKVSIIIIPIPGELFRKCNALTYACIEQFLTHHESYMCFLKYVQRNQFKSFKKHLLARKALCSGELWFSAQYTLHTGLSTFPLSNTDHTMLPTLAKVKKTKSA